MLASAMLALAAVAGPSCPGCDSVLMANNFAGVAAVRRSPTDVVYKRPFGKRDFVSGVDMTDDTRFPIGSNTKAFVAVALYQLQEQGLVSLSQPISDYLDNDDFAAFGLPHLSVYCPTIANQSGSACAVAPTFVELLAMNSGFGTLEAALCLYELYPGSIGAIVGTFITAPLLFVPGATFFYSNAAFVLASYFVEKFSGLPLAEYFEQRITSVLGMKDTYYSPFGNQFGADPLRVMEFRRFIDPTTQEMSSVGRCWTELNLGIANGAGGVISTVDDEAKFYYTLFNVNAPKDTWGGPVLHPDSVEAMLKPRVLYNDTAYFAQGVVVVPNMTTGLPLMVEYQGDLVCVFTTNILDLRQNPPFLAQLFTAAPAFYASKAQVDHAKRETNQTLPDILSTFPQPPSLIDQTLGLLDAAVENAAPDTTKPSIKQL